MIREKPERNTKCMYLKDIVYYYLGEENVKNVEIRIGASLVDGISGANMMETRRKYRY